VRTLSVVGDGCRDGVGGARLVRELVGRVRRGDGHVVDGNGVEAHLCRRALHAGRAIGEALGVGGIGRDGSDLLDAAVEDVRQ
jgi:hypothetical protein